MCVELLKDGIDNRVFSMQDGKIVDIDIFEPLKITKTLDVELCKFSNKISI